MLSHGKAKSLPRNLLACSLMSLSNAPKKKERYLDAIDNKQRTLSESQMRQESFDWLS